MLERGTNDEGGVDNPGLDEILELAGGGVEPERALARTDLLDHHVAVVTGIVFLTELTSNTATTATMVPLLAAIAPGLGLEPLMLIVPAAIAASCAFMLPVATPPNAIVFGSGLIPITVMSRAGFWLNWLGIVLITLLTYAVLIPAFGL